VRNNVEFQISTVAKSHIFIYQSHDITVQCNADVNASGVNALTRGAAPQAASRAEPSRHRAATDRNAVKET